MNLNQIINLFMRLFGRRLLDAGLRKGVELAAGKGKAPEQMTEAERKAVRDANEAVGRARKAMRLTRRF